MDHKFKSVKSITGQAINLCSSVNTGYFFILIRNAWLKSVTSSQHQVCYIFWLVEVSLFYYGKLLNVIFFSCFPLLSSLSFFPLTCVSWYRWQVIQIPEMHVLPLLENRTKYGWNMKTGQMILRLSLFTSKGFLMYGCN